MFLSLINDFNKIFDMLILHIRNSKKFYLLKLHVLESRQSAPMESLVLKLHVKKPTQLNYCLGSPRNES